MTDVACSVENCAYWNNKKCQAPAIDVHVHGDLNGSAGQAMDSQGTMCKTFRPDAKR